MVLTHCENFKGSGLYSSKNTIWSVNYPFWSVKYRFVRKSTVKHQQLVGTIQLFFMTKYEVISIPSSTNIGILIFYRGVPNLVCKLHMLGSKKLERCFLKIFIP